VAERAFFVRKRSVRSPAKPCAGGSTEASPGKERTMYELEQVSESLVLRSLGYNPSPLVGEWRETPLMVGLDKLLREIGTYLEFVAIARGR